MLLRFFALVIATISVLAIAEVREGGRSVVTDQEVSLSFEEIAYIVERAPPEIQSQVRTSEVSRYELIANAVAAKRVLERLEHMDEANQDLFVAFQFEVLSTAREFDEKRFQRDLRIPDLDALTRERWRVSRNEIAKVPEKRSLSHILILCSEDCDVDMKRQEMEDIRKRVLAGESFSDLALEFSQDPGSKQRGGRLRRAFSFSDENVDMAFRETAFQLKEKGDVSDVVKSRFGFHIMRLEKIEPEREYTFDEVKESLMAEVERRYRKDAYRDYLLSMGPTDALRIDQEAIDSIMGKLPEVEEVEPPQE